MPAKRPAKKRTPIRQVPPPKKNKGGRDLYNPAYVQQVRKMAQMGWTHIEMASFLDVTDRTFRRWLLKYPELVEALSIPEEQANARVRLGLYQLATGFEREEEEIKVIEGKIVRVKVIRYYPPNASAAIFWQKAKAGWTDNPDMRDPLPQPPADGEPDATVNETDKQIARRLNHFLVIHQGGR